AIAILEKLEVGHLSPLEARQQAKRRCDFLPGHVRFVGKRAEEGDAATCSMVSVTSKSSVFQKRWIAAKTSDSAFGPLCVPVHGSTFFSSGLSKFNET